MNDSVNVPGYVIKRKRKRSRNINAVDPCLGFYVPSLSLRPPLLAPVKSPPQAVTSLSSNRDTSLTVPVLPATPPQDYLDSRVESATLPRCSLEAVVTVEEFLRRSADKPTKKYGRRKRRLVDLRSQEQGQAASNSDEADLQPKRPPKKRRRMSSAIISTDSSPGGQLPLSPRVLRERKPPQKKAANSLAKRIIQAAVLSHVEPAESLIHRDNLRAPARKPLQFVPVGKETPRPNLAPKLRKATLVDPRKVSPFSGAVLSFHAPSRPLHVAKSPDRLPFTTWKKTTFRSAHERRPNKAKALAVVRMERRSNCPPLSFVPLKDAEAAYALKSATQYPSATQGIEEACSTNDRSDILSRPPLPFVTTCIPLRRPRNEGPGTKCAVHKRPVKLVKFASSTSPSPTPSSGTEAATSSTIVVPQSEPPMDSAVIVSESVAPASPEMVHNRKRPSLQTNSKKPLVGLGTLLNGFMETARSATLMQTARMTDVDQSGRSSNKRSTTLVTHNSAIEQTSNSPLDAGPTSLQPVGSMVPATHTSTGKLGTPGGPSIKSFSSITTRSHMLYKSIAQPSPTSPLPPRESKIVKRRSVRSMAQKIPPVLDRDRCDMSIVADTLPHPNVLAALKPPQSQVVLSSSPSDTSLSLPRNDRGLGFDADSDCSMTLGCSIDLFAGLDTSVVPSSSR